jgi:hypothetical protein
MPSHEAAETLLAIGNCCDIHCHTVENEFIRLQQCNLTTPCAAKNRQELCIEHVIVKVEYQMSGEDTAKKTKKFTFCFA